MTDTVVDRRLNPRGKNLSNRQRFLARARTEVKRAVQDALRNRKVGDVARGEDITIPTGGITESIFHHGRTGRRHHVVPGNKRYQKGDQIPRPQGGGNKGGREGSPDGSGEDGFEFTLTKDEFLDMFFEDLELPDLVRKSLKDTTTYEIHRAGFTVDGSPATMSIPRTMRQSMARRMSLKRPKISQLEELRKTIERARANENAEGVDIGELELRLERMERRSKVIPFIDPIDVRYRRFERIPKLNTEAVMFCLMDVSGSMTEAMKDLAKRFFMLLHTFLIRRYLNVDVVFIRHTSMAEEVDEDTFFYSRETGGTVVSSVLEKMLEIVRARYSSDRWNIYGAQASDGDNNGVDGSKCITLLGGELLPLCQHFAYIEVGDGSGGILTGLSRASELWRSYAEVAPAHPNFAMRRVGDPAQIWPVFHELFAKGGIHA